jgi:organic hydroperoxide reductase OsmC/OhrA
MAHEYRATVRWTREDGAPFTDNKYNRGHVWRFDGGVEVPASSAPSSVPLPYSRADAVDPEEAFVASLSSCHMLFFLWFSAKAGFVVDAYEDQALGVMTKNERGKLFVSKVTLNPRVEFSGERRPAPDEIAELHHRSHEECFIANSVRTEVVVAGLPVHA